MKILTDEEILHEYEQLCNPRDVVMKFARAIEQAILERIGEPFIHVRYDDDGYVEISSRRDPIAFPLFAIKGVE
jgi:hypothetical protein